MQGCVVGLEEPLSPMEINMKPSALLILLTFLCAPQLQAQQVWVVDDNFSPGVDFLDIQSAVDNVADGDTLLLRDGTYAGFIIDAKSLTLVADGNGTPDVQGGIVLSNLAVGGHLRLTGLTVSNLQIGDGLQASNLLGSLLVDTCNITGGHGVDYAGVALTDCASVTFMASTVLGGLAGNSNLPTALEGGAGIRATDSNLYLLQTTVTGEAGSTGTSQVASVGDGGLGGVGLLLQGGFLGCQTSSVTAGRGGDGIGSIVAGCGDAGNGGDGLRLDVGISTGAPTAELNSTPTMAGVAGNPGTQCAPGVDGSNNDILAGIIQTYATPGSDLQITRPFRDGQFGFVTVLGNPGDVVQIAVSNSSQTAWDPLTMAPSVPQSPTLYSIGVIPAWGVLNRAVKLGLSGGSLAQHYVLQVMSGPSGGTMTPGTSAVLSVIDTRY